jgi:hypothetical protein
MYVQGSYNADGSITAFDKDKPKLDNSAKTPDDADEKPAALVADAITILSAGFDISQTSNKPATTGGDVEISAALLMGLTPTNPKLTSTGESSGGAHNFPRFLENWTVANYIRGSLVALFESRIATEPWSTDYYSPPSRNWGFNQLFADGKFPPGTPKVMSYRRVNFTNLDAKGYQDKRSSFNWTSSH